MRTKSLSKTLLAQTVASLALLAFPAATFASSEVSRVSVVDQYTEVIPAPDGGKPNRQPTPPEAAPGVEVAPAAEAVVEQAVPNEQRARKQKAKRVVQKERELVRLAKASFESPAAPGGMGTLFPALLLLGLVASAGFMIGRHQGAGRRSGRR